ncbi:MAG TPA: hypothetical protein VH025_03965 [Solirubrobacteraceae bacterium]|jgi:MFS family permease|nr:hypothetical protein [Solirubrobacteraceae bacterium]
MVFDSRRFRRSEQIVGASAILFLVSLFFFSWLGSDVGGASSGWRAFTDSRWFWLATILVGLAAVLVRGFDADPRLPVALSGIVTWFGGVSVILVLYRLFHHPSVDLPGFHVGLRAGIWLGLLSAAGITYGGFVAMEEEGITPKRMRREPPQRDP